jgi:hypothetical protein
MAAHLKEKGLSQTWIKKELLGLNLVAASLNE